LSNPVSSIELELVIVEWIRLMRVNFACWRDIRLLVTGMMLFIVFLCRLSELRLMRYQ